MHRRKLKVDVYISPSVPKGEPASVHHPGLGKIQEDTQLELMSLLGTLDYVELYKCLNFRNSFIKDGRVYTDDHCLNDLDVYFWYCELDRNVGSYDLEVLKTLAQAISVVINPV
jgi:hypothetical protein